MAPMISDAELAILRTDGEQAMPDTATILRLTAASTAGGHSETYAQVGTTQCRLTASVLSGGTEQMGAGQLVATMAYTMTVPPGTDIRDSDRIVCQGTTFEVLAGKRVASWNLSDSYTLEEIQS